MDRYEFYDKINSYKKNDELKHYGTIGQKWGVRHWQNADGTFNAAGKERYFGSGKYTPVGKSSADDQKIGGNFWNQTKARTFMNITDQGKVKHIKKYADYFDIDGLSDDDILKVVRMTPEVDPYGTTTYADRINQNLYKYKVNNSLAKAADTYSDNNQKVGGLFGKKGNDIGTGEHLKEIHELKRQINEFEDAGLDTSSLEKMLKYYESKDDYRYGSQPGSKDETIKTTIGSLFSKKDNNLADKIREQAKELRKVGENDLADKYEARAKELDQYKKIGSQPGMSDEERKATKRACANCWKVAMRNKWPLFLLFGLIGGPIIGAIASNSKINKMIDQLGLDRQNKDKFTADDWDKITEAIKESRRKKPKNAE